MATPKCLVLDFDYTLAHFTGGLGFLETFVSVGLRREEVEQLYNEVVHSPEGFTIGRLIEKAATLVEIDESDRARLAREFEEWLAESLATYSDALRCIERTESAGIPWVIVTAGDDSYQRQKIKALGLTPAEIIVVTPVHGKAEAIRTLIARFGRPVWFVDDSPNELDRVRAAGLSESDVATFLLVRSDSLHTQVSPRHPHTSITTLDDVRERVPVPHVDQ